MVSFRGGSLGPPLQRSPVVMGTLISLVVLYVAMGFALRFAPAFENVYTKLILTTEGVLSGELWRLVTYAVLHSLHDPFHLVINGLMLFFFGRDLEVLWGPKRFLLFMLGAVLAGGLAVFVAGVTGLGIGSAIGFSAVIEAAIVAWALHFRDRQILLFFVAPVRGVWMIGLAFLNWILDAASQSPASASAHLGGILFGLAIGLAPLDRIRLWNRRRKQARFTVVPKDGDKWVH